MNVIHNRKAAVTGAILDEAARLLSEGGPEDVTLQKIAKALGYATTAIYRYFDSKEAMIVALQTRALHELQNDLVSALTAAANETALTRICVAAFVYSTLNQRRPTAFRLIALSLADPVALMADEAVAPVARDVAGLLTALSVLLDAASAEGTLGKGDVSRAAIAWTSLHGLMVARKLGRLPALKALRDDAIIDEALTALLIGFGGDKPKIIRAIARAHTLVETL